VTESIQSPVEDTSYLASTEAQTALRAGRRQRDNLYLYLARALALLLAGYLLFDRAFAWLHVPGTPLFVGEIVLAFGLYVAIRSRQAGRFIRLSPPMQMLVVFMAFGTMLTIIGAMSHDPQEAARDAAIWYYGLFAIVIGTLARAWEPAYEFFINWYVRIIPVFLAVGVVRLFFANRDGTIFVPDSEVAITSHKPGNLGVQAVMAVAFLLLVVAPELDRKGRTRNLVLTVGGLLLLALAGTQNRGTLVAGFIALFIIYFAGKAARPVMGGVLVAVLALMVLSFAFNVRIQLERREVSIEQLLANILTLSVPDNPDGEVADDGTVAWRLKLWDLVLDDTLSSERFLSGFGFGENLASKYGFVAGPDVGPELRNPHNSHLSVVARMGLIGAGLWITLWVMWYRHLWKARKRFKFAGDEQKAGFLAWCMVAAMAALINGIFDPSLEGPQAAVWLWCIFGLGAFVAVEGTVVRWRKRTPAWARPGAA